MFHERIVEFTPVLAYSKDSPLASADPVTEDELKTLIEVAPGDFDVPSMAPEEVRREQYPDGDFRRVLTPSRAGAAGNSFRAAAELCVDGAAHAAHAFPLWA